MSSNADGLKVTREGPVARLVLSRPERHNAFDEALIASLTRAFGELVVDTKVRVVVLSGEGRSFCAGADASWMQRQSAMNFEENLDDARKLAQLLYVAGTFPKPLVAAVQGAAFGGGMGLACCADMVAASGDALFSLSEVRLGLIPAVISPWVMRRTGEAVCRRLALTAERLEAREAFRLGIVDSVAEVGEVESAVQETLAQLLKGAPGAQAEAKALLRKLDPLDEEQLEVTARSIAERRATPEAREGLAAFLGKRAPKWNGA